MRSTTCRVKEFGSFECAGESNIHYAYQNKTASLSSILVPLLFRLAKREINPSEFQFAAFSLGLGASVGCSGVVTVKFFVAIYSTTAAKFTWEIKFCTN